RAADVPQPESTVRSLFLAEGHPIDHVVLHSGDVEATTRYARRLLMASLEHWTQLRGDGRTEIFGWSSAPTDAAARRFEQNRFDPEAQAFRASAPSEETRLEGAPRQPRLLNLWEQYVQGAAPHAPAYAEAQRYLNYHDAQ